MFRLDINECSTNNGGCSHICGNNFGSFACGCPTGWSLMADRLTCRGNYQILLVIVL